MQNLSKEQGKMAKIRGSMGVIASLAGNISKKWFSSIVVS